MGATGPGPTPRAESLAPRRAAADGGPRAPEPTLTLAILLAAGRGRRMGAPKAHLELAGRSALARCLDALAGAGVDRVRLVLHPDDTRAAEVAARADVAVTLVPQAHPERGQTSSLKLALADDTGAHRALLLHTVDHPLVSADDVRTLLAAFDARAPGTALVVPSVSGRRGHPLVFAPEVADEFRGLGDDEPAHRIVRRNDARIVHVVMERPWLVRDLDTPQDLRAARAALAGDEFPATDGTPDDPARDDTAPDDGDQPTSRT